MTCVEGSEAKKMVEEIHSGSCWNHSGGRSLAIKIKRHGYYRPTMIADCDRFARKCEKCQRHAPTIRQHAEELSSISSPYLFMRWSVDIIDNGSQFISTRFEAFCEKWKIRLTKSAPRYLQGNGQAETINKTILDGLKKPLEAKKGRWAEELECVLWSYRTTPRRATRETPFALVYGTECMIRAEVEFPGVRRRLLPEREESNNAMLLDDLDLINERRDQALIRIKNYQHAAAKYNNTNVRHRRFKEDNAKWPSSSGNSNDANLLSTESQQPRRDSKPAKGPNAALGRAQIPTPRDVANSRIRVFPKINWTDFLSQHLQKR
ncbi:uncharacterized protein LOC125592591 [Brassica napus]|uniref:uncharacterized protein LOC125592591 n=1 Tax=Brassica napus TaxID=3708 RepID=UPI00207AFADA|nr:uncharacterized protein LOC125592591 [Brassica napus]